MSIDELRNYGFLKELDDNQLNEIAVFLANYATIVYNTMNSIGGNDNG